MRAGRAFYIDISGFKEAEWGNNDFTSISRDKAALYLCEGGQGSTGSGLWIGFDGYIISLCSKRRE